MTVDINSNIDTIGWFTKIFKIGSAANRSKNYDFVQNADQMLQMVRKWSQNYDQVQKYRKGLCGGN